MNREMLNLFKLYCAEEQNIENPTDDDARATHESYSRQAGSSEKAEEMVMFWASVNFAYSGLVYH